MLIGRRALRADRGEKRGMALRHSALLLIGGVLLRRGLRFPVNLWDPAVVVWGISTSWTDNAVSDPYHLTVRSACLLMIADPPENARC